MNGLVVPPLFYSNSVPHTPAVSSDDRLVLFCTVTCNMAHAYHIIARMFLEDLRHSDFLPHTVLVQSYGLSVT